LLNILQISNKAPFPANDGSSIAIYNMAQGFIQNGVNLHLLTINTKKHFKSDVDVPNDFKKLSHYKSVYHNTNTHFLGLISNLFSSQSYFVSRFYFKEFEQELTKVLNENTFQIIQLEGLFMAVYMPIIKKYSEAKIVLRAHNIEHLIWERHIILEGNFLKKRYLKLQAHRLKKFEWEMLKAVDAIITITDCDKKFIEKQISNQKIYSAITGVDIQKYQPEKINDSNNNSIFYFASMDWLPNQEAVKWFLANCWNTIFDKRPQTKLIIAGRGMPQFLKQLNLPNVQVIENVPDGKKFFAQHHLMIVPLLSGSGLRIKIIEGMAYGKTIVSTSVGAEGINYTHKKNIIIADTPEDFSNAVINVLNNEELSKSLSNNALNLAASEFDNKTVVSKLVAYYNTWLNV
jgi:polysaccharide biosynthesis protein PslH